MKKLLVLLTFGCVLLLPATSTRAKWLIVKLPSGCAAAAAGTARAHAASSPRTTRFIVRTSSRSPSREPRSAG